MGPLSFIDDHRSKLLEMCAVLFPGREFKIGNKWDRDEVWTWDEKGVPIEIHWFEFMMTELAEKLFNPNPDKPARSLQDRMKQFFWQVNVYWDDTRNGRKPLYNHPIDDLYKLFKELK